MHRLDETIADDAMDKAEWKHGERRILSMSTEIAPCEKCEMANVQQNAIGNAHCAALGLFWAVVTF